MIRRVLIWYLMLTKRLLKKIGFMIILFLIPVFAFVFHMFNKEGSGGLLRIALAVEDDSDALGVEMMEDISGKSDVFQFTICQSEEEAKRMVEGAKADAAWVFVKDIEEKLQEVANGDTETLVRIYESEENVLLKIAREKIFGVLFPHIAYYMYAEHITDKMLPQEEITETLLREEYEIIGEDDSFIEFTFLDSKQKSIQDVNYLISTVRGLLMAIMLLAGIASTMYYLHDEENGTFSWLPPNRRIWVLWGSNLAALSLAGVFVTLALLLGGTYTTFVVESISMLLFILMATAFCSILGVVFRTVNRLCIMLPTVLVAAIVFCPVFFNTRLTLQQILPPYYYLYAINNVGYLKWMLLYCVIAYPLGYLWQRKRL